MRQGNPVQLPLEDASVSGRSRAAAQVNFVRRPGDIVRILLIDDDEMVLGIIALMLSSDGHTVLAASSGRDGLARLEAGESVDLVLTDLRMPDMSGWDVIRAVRARWPSIRVGFNSGSRDALLDPSEPIDVQLRKPVSFDDLRAAIKRLE
jgi:CheY-like chemotaxis protein